MAIQWLAWLLLFGAWGSASAAAINVLWYTYADPLSEYRGASTGIQGIANLAPTYAQGSGLEWNLSFFDNSSPLPDFSAYDVLVTESGEAFRTGAPGGPLAVPNYDAILNNRAAISAARGDRTYISGTDADFHAIRGDSGQCAAFSGCGEWDGARGYLVNMVNWAASGNGLGIVALLDGEFPAVADRWWAQPTSFLHDELAGHIQYFRDNAPVISQDAAAYPLNGGLSSQGLGDWRNSFHAGFIDVAGYTGTVFSTARPGVAVSIATTTFVAAATTPAPAPVDISIGAPDGSVPLGPIVRPGMGGPGITLGGPGATNIGPSASAVPLPGALVHIGFGMLVLTTLAARKSSARRYPPAPRANPIKPVVMAAR